MNHTNHYSIRNNKSAEIANISSFMQCFPKTCLAGWKKDFASPQPLKRALPMKYANLNEGGYRYMIIDIDRDYRSELTELATGCPMPNFVIMNPENYHAQLFYRLEHSINPENMKSLRYYNDIQTGMNSYFDGDLAFNGTYAKNPNNYSWDVIHLRDEAWTLSEMLPYARPYIVRHTTKIREVGVGRNCTIFDVVRFRGYAISRYLRGMSTTAGEQKIYRMCVDTNYECFATNLLPDRECRSIAKSICKYIQGPKFICYQRKSKIIIDRTLDAPERQRLGALHSAKVRSANSALALEKATKEMVAAGLRPSLRGLSKYTGKSTNTVHRWKHLNLETYNKLLEGESSDAGKLACQFYTPMPQLCKAKGEPRLVKQASTSTIIQLRDVRRRKIKKKVADTDGVIRPKKSRQRSIWMVAKPRREDFIDEPERLL